ncbi:MAG: FhaA domain-containing protein [Dermatophilaceae bacterium]
MGLFDRVEHGLERAVHGVFAKAFKAEVQPVEIASAMRRAMDDRAAVIGHGRTFVPNLFAIELSPTDFERLMGFSDMLADELVASAQEHAESQRYQPGGPIQVSFVSMEDLETGVFRVRPSTAKNAPPAVPSSAPVAPPEAGSEGPAASLTPTPPPAEPSGAEPASAEAWAWAPAAGAAAPPAREPVAPSVPRTHPAQRPWLEVDGDHYPLLSAITVLGRDNSADVILDDPGISRRHTEIRVTSDGPHLVASIRDLGSTNGTFVNGERITSQHLADGDRISVGRTALTYRGGHR